MIDAFSGGIDFLTWQDANLNFDHVVKPWKPQVIVDRENWPPDYRAVYAWRAQTLQKIRSDEKYLQSARAYYATRPIEFITHWVDTYDPRRPDAKWIPFVFFKRQAEFIMFLEDLRKSDENGLAEKCRDAGVTWCGCAYSAWQIEFLENTSTGWGSRKATLVDDLGNPDSIFEKIRLIFERLPNEFKSNYEMPRFRIMNQDNGSVIIGEGGDNIGRGGRTGMFFKDESAHYERPEKIEAALGDNTNVQVDISSVNGFGNPFHRRREAGVEWYEGREIEPGFTRVFIFDWRDHPAKTQEWYDQRKARAEREGLQHLFAQEVDRDYSAAVMNTIIPFEYIDASVDAHKRIRWRDERGVIHVGLTDEQLSGRAEGGLDIADEGLDKNAAAVRQGIVWRDVEEWGARDVGVTTRESIAFFRRWNVSRVQYDIIGVGSGVKAEYNSLVDKNHVDPKKLKFIPWNAGAGVVNPNYYFIPDDRETGRNKDLFANMKAQAWWSIRTRFYKTWRNLTDGELYPIEDLISLDSSMKLLQQLKKELAQPTRGESGGLKMIINKTPPGTKSPNLADAGIMMYFPLDEQATGLMGNYGTGN